MIRRPLTAGERSLARSVFGEAIDYARVTMNHRAWWPFQPRQVVMSPDGHLWFNPRGDLWREDYAAATLSLQALFIHEMTHVWQAQTRGRWWLPLMRHPFCRYRYTLRDGWPFERYGIEQQAEIVRHAFLARRGIVRDGVPPIRYAAILPFGGGAGEQV